MVHITRAVWRNLTVGFTLVALACTTLSACIGTAPAAITGYWTSSDGTTLCVIVMGSALNDPNLKTRVVSQTTTEVVLEATDRARKGSSTALGNPNYQSVKLRDPLGDRIVTTRLFGAVPRVSALTYWPDSVKSCNADA